MKKETRVIRNLHRQENKARSEVRTPIASGMFIPNHSGDHSRGKVLETQERDDAPANKKYVDDAIAAGTGTVVSTFPVFNNSGSAITKGTPVHAGAWNVGQNAVQVELADADNSADMPCLGLALTDISNGGTGFVIYAGELTGLDTSSFSAGDELYVSTTAGQLTATKPTSNTAATQKVAQVLRSNASAGVLAVFGAGRSNDVPNSTATKMIMTADNSSADTQFTPQVLYNTDATPPTASNFPIGTIYIQYTA